MKRRQFLHLAAGSAALATATRFAWGEAYPSHPVRLIVGFAAGGATDIQARLMGDWLSERLGQQFIVENKPGASGNIGTDTVAKAPPDGYTLLLAGRDPACDQFRAFVQQSRSSTFVRDIAPVHVIDVARLAYVVVVNPSVPVRTIPELIAYAKANPGKLNYGLGRPGHPAAKHFLRTLQDDDRGEPGPHPVQGRARPRLPIGSPATLQVIFAPVSEAIQPDQGRCAARPGGHDRDPPWTGVSGPSGGRRISCRVTRPAAGFAGIGVPKGTPGPKSSTG